MLRTPPTGTRSGVSGFSIASTIAVPTISGPGRPSALSFSSLPFHSCHSGGTAPYDTYDVLHHRAYGECIRHWDIAQIGFCGGCQVMAAWLGGIIVNLLLVGGYGDIALRDFGLLLGALTLSRLASAFAGDQPRPRVRT